MINEALFGVFGSREIWPKIGWEQGAFPQNKLGAGSIGLGAGSIGTKKSEHVEYLRWEQGDLGPKYPGAGRFRPPKEGLINMII